MDEIRMGEILTPEETRILAFIAQEKLYTTIARELGISLSTLQQSIALIYKKLNVNSAAGAVAQAFLHNLLSDEQIDRKVPAKYGACWELTQVECEVMSWLARKFSYTQISTKMKINKTEIRALVELAKHKLGTKTTPAAVEIARRKRMLIDDIVK